MKFRLPWRRDSSQKHEILGDLLGVELGQHESIDDLATRITQQQMAAYSELKDSPHWTLELQRLEEAAASISEDDPDAHEEAIEALFKEIHRVRRENGLT